MELCVILAAMKSVLLPRLQNRWKHSFGKPVSAILIVLFTNCGVFACECLDRRSVCSAIGDATAVFVGEVTDGKASNRMSDMINAGTKDQTFKFKVERSFLGVSDGDTIDIHTGFGFGDCGFPFQKGQEYVVYAYKEEDGLLHTSVCSRTSPLMRAAEDLNELPIQLKKKGATVSGKITRYERPSLLGEPRVPLVNTAVTLTSDDGKTFKTRTDLAGKYSLSGLPGGHYKLEIETSPGWEVSDSDDEEAFLLNEHGCVTKDRDVENDSEVKVTVLDPSGTPLTNRWVEFVPVGVTKKRVDFPDEFHVTNPQGQVYEFSLPPGRYTVSVNYMTAPDAEAPYPTTFAPGVTDIQKAQIVTIQAGTKLDPITIRVPRVLSPLTVRGTVVFADGSPAKKADVGLLDAVAKHTCVTKCFDADSNGGFELTGYEGREYRVFAQIDREIAGKSITYRIESAPFKLTNNLQGLKLILRSQR